MLARRAKTGDEGLELDLAVALTVGGYRWVEWNPRSMADAPHHEPGRFVARPDDLQSHLQVDADPDAPLAPHAYRRLPHYSRDLGLAMGAAESAGLFGEGAAVLAKSADGAWRVAVGMLGTSLKDDSLPRLLCRAALRWNEAGHAAEDP